MDLWRDRAYDLDLDSFVGTTPMPGPLLGCSPELRDGWSDQVRVPGGLHEDDIQALGERTSTQHHRPAGRGGTVYDQHGVPIDDNGNVAVEDVRTHDEWLATKAPSATATVAAGASMPSNFAHYMQQPRSTVLCVGYSCAGCSSTRYSSTSTASG